MEKIKKLAVRQANLDNDSIDIEKRTASMTFMTEEPCDNWYVPESVVCTKAACDTTRQKNGVMPLLFNHDRNMIIGTVGEISFADGKARAVVTFFSDEEGEKIFQKVQQGLRGVSVGYMRLEVNRIEAGNSFNGVTYKKRTDVTTKWEPYEISIVSIPADKDTGIGRDMEGDTEEIPVKQIEGRKKTMDNNTPKGTQMTPEELQKEREKAMQAERTRISTITNLCRRHKIDDKKMEEFVNDGEMTVDKARAAILDILCERDKPLPANFHVGDNGEREHFRDMVVDAMCLRYGVAVEKPTEGCGRYRFMSLRTLGETILEDNGMRDVRNMSDDQLLSKLTYERAMGSEQFQGIIDDFANKTMMNAYKEQDFIFPMFVSKGENKDFKPTHRYEMGLSGVPVLMPPESGEFKYQTMGDAKVSTQISTYGKGIAFTREIFINDDLGQVQRVISLQAGGFRRLQEMMFFETLKKVTFSKANGNLVQTNLDISAKAYDEMSRLMRSQKDLNNEGFIGVTPKFLLAPDNQAMQHRVLLASASDPAQNNPGVINPAKNQMQLYTSPYLDGDEYYAIAAPNQMPGIEFTTLRGMDQPQSRTIIPQEYLGLHIQMWQDFGFNILGYKAFVKNPNKK